MPILCGLASQSRLLPNLVDLKFIYTKGDPLFHYTCPSDIAATFHLKLHSAYLAIKRCRLYPSVESQIVSKLNSGVPALYHFRHAYARNFSIRKGENYARLPNVLLTGT